MAVAASRYAAGGRSLGCLPLMQHLRHRLRHTEGGAGGVEDGVGVGLVDAAHGQAPVQHLEHLVLDVHEQLELERVEHVAPPVEALRGDRGKVENEWRGAVGGGGSKARCEGSWYEGKQGRGGVLTSMTLTSLSRDTLQAMTHPPSSIDRTE